MLNIVERSAPVAAALFAVGVTSFGSVAQATQSVAAAPSVTVRYADLDLNTPKGVETLYERLRAAAQEVCGRREARAVFYVAAARACYDEALATAVSRVESEPLNALHRVANARKRVS
jgi:UrcA family protein